MTSFILPEGGIILCIQLQLLNVMNSREGLVHAHLHRGMLFSCGLHLRSDKRSSTIFLVPIASTFSAVFVIQPY